MKVQWLVAPTLCFNVAMVGATTNANDIDYSQVAAGIAANTKTIVEERKDNADLIKIKEQSQNQVVSQNTLSQQLTEQAMANARSGQTQAQIQKVFPNLKPDELKKVIGGQTAQESVVYRGPILFMSLSMPEPAVKEAFRVAVEKHMPINFIGLVTASPKLPDTVAYLKKLAKEAGVSEEPWVQLAPNDFIKYQVNMAPTIIQDEGNGHFHRMEGSINIDYFIEQRNAAEETHNYVNEKVGPSFPIKEKSLIDDLKERMAKIDWETKKKQAVDRFWQNQYYTDLPPATKNASWRIDPTVRVKSDVTDRSGNVMARKGEITNPLSMPHMPVRMMVFNPLRPEEIEFVKKYRTDHPFQGQTILMGTTFTRDRGWDVLKSTTETLQSRIYLAPQTLVERFHLSGTPAVIETAGKYFNVQQIDTRIPENGQIINKVEIKQ